MNDNFSFAAATRSKQQLIVGDWLPPLIIGLLMLWTAQINLLLFHTLAEFFAIIIAIMSTVVCWYMYRFSRNDFLLYLGCAYFWIAMLDMMHAFAYKGMPMFGFETSNPGIQLWIVTRYFEALVLLTAPLFIRRKINPGITFALFGAISILFFSLVMTGHFPTMHIEGQGLEPAKVISEYIIIAILGLAIAHLLSQRNMLAPKIVALMVASMVFTMAAEMTFTFYVSDNDFSNQLGHFFKMSSYWTIYLAIIETSLRTPFQTMARGISTYDAIPESVVAIDRNGIIRQANETASTMASTNRERLIGQHCHAYFHSPDIKSDQCPACHHINSQQGISSMEIYNGYKNQWTELTLSLINAPNFIEGMVHTIRDISHRKATELELEQNRNKLAYFRNAIDETTDAVYLIDPETMEFIDSNKAGWESLGYSRSELTQLNPGAILNQLSDEEIKEIFSTTINHQYSTEIITRHTRKDGSSFPVEIRFNHFYANNRDMVTAMARDITQRLQTEQELQESKQRIHDIIDNIPGIVFQYTLDAEDKPSFNYVSTQIMTIFGISSEAVTQDAHAWIDTIYPDDKAAMDASILESKQNLNRWNWEGRAINKTNNSILWFHGTAQPRRMDDGSTAWNGIISDITDIKQARQALSELNDIINHSSSIAFLWGNTPDRAVEYVSENISQIGYSPDDFYSDRIKFTQIIHPADLQRVTNEVKEFSQNPTDEAFSQQYRLIDKDGTIHWIEDQIRIKRDENNTITHYQGIVLDITQRKKIETELKTHRENLELRIWERTKELANARDEAIRATEIKSEFLANISHELRTPLNSIIGFTGIIKDGLAGAVNHEQVKQLAIIDDSAKHLLSLINDILDISKIEANKASAVNRAFNPKALLSDIINMINPLAHDKGLTLNHDFSNCPDVIHADPAKLRQILLNLISNAIKFTDHGTITLNCDPQEKQLYFHVIDTGQGIDDSDFTRIFDAFTQADSSSTRAHSGTGLGLTISRQYARLMAGDITVTSIRGQGSRFTLVLPAQTTSYTINLDNSDAPDKTSGDSA